MASKSDVMSGRSYERGSPCNVKSQTWEGDSTLSLTISLSGELSHGYMNDKRMQEGISDNLREDMLMNGRVGQGYGLPVDGNSQRDGMRVDAFASGKQGRVVVKPASEWLSKRGS